MRKQILIIICAAVVFFLLGTLVSMGLTANGIMPNPFENRVSEKHIVRLTKLDEINITNYNAGNWDGVSFVWNPMNPNNNLIMSVYCYFELHAEGEQSLMFRTSIRIDGLTSTFYIGARRSEKWEMHCYQAVFTSQNPQWIIPNQEIYNITQVIGGMGVSFSVPTYVRNINLIMEVIDG